VLRSGTSRIDRPGRSDRRSSRCWYSRWRARECRGRLPRRSGPRYATRETRLAPFFDVDDATGRVHMGGRCSGRSRRANITDVVRLNLEPTTQRVNRCHHRKPSACATGLGSGGAVDSPVRLDSHAMPSRRSFDSRGGGAGLAAPTDMPWSERVEAAKTLRRASTVRPPGFSKNRSLSSRSRSPTLHQTQFCCWPSGGVGSCRTRPSLAEAARSRIGVRARMARRDDR